MFFAPSLLKSRLSRLWKNRCYSLQNLRLQALYWYQLGWIGSLIFICWTKVVMALGLIPQKVWTQNVFFGGDFHRLYDVQYGLRPYCTSYNLTKYPPKKHIFGSNFLGNHPMSHTSFCSTDKYQRTNSTKLVPVPESLTWYQYQVSQKVLAY